MKGSIKLVTAYMKRKKVEGVKFRTIWYATGIIDHVMRYTNKYMHYTRVLCPIEMESTINTKVMFMKYQYSLTLNVYFDNI